MGCGCKGKDDLPVVYRKVRYFQWEPSNPKDKFRNPKRVLKGEGIFHGWGSNYEEFENGPGTFSTAIVEVIEDGKVLNLPVEDIEFVDNFEKYFNILGGLIRSAARGER